jgi:hypothetical protein
LEYVIAYVLRGVFWRKASKKTTRRNFSEDWNFSISIEILLATLYV